MTHYSSEYQNSKIIEKNFSVNILNHFFNFTTATGTFSKNNLDRATGTLIKYAHIKDQQEVLDLGCGWGPIGIILKKAFPKIDITMADTNRRALNYAKLNAQENNVEAKILFSDIFSKIDKKFDTILTNPPYAAGRKVCYAFIEQSFLHLKKGGSLQLVARHQKGGAMLEKKMQEIFGNVETLAKKGGFRVYKSIKAL